MLQNNDAETLHNSCYYQTWEHLLISGINGALLCNTLWQYMLVYYRKLCRACRSPSRASLVTPVIYASGFTWRLHWKQLGRAARCNKHKMEAGAVVVIRNSLADNAHYAVCFVNMCKLSLIYRLAPWYGAILLDGWCLCDIIKNLGVCYILKAICNPCHNSMHAM